MGDELEELKASLKPTRRKWDRKTFFPSSNDDNVLAWHDGPLVFFLFDKYDYRYLAYMIDEFHYVVFRADYLNESLQSFLSSQMDIRNYFMTAGNCYLVYCDGDDFKMWVTRGEDIPSSYIPRSGVKWIDRD